LAVTTRQKNGGPNYDWKMVLQANHISLMSMGRGRWRSPITNSSHSRVSCLLL